METFIETTELCERSLRHFAASKSCTLQKNGCDYTIIQNNEPILMADDEDTWAVLNAM